MYEKATERSEGEIVALMRSYGDQRRRRTTLVLDDRIDHFGELVKSYYGVEELGDPSAVTEVRTSPLSFVTLPDAFVL